jgi:glyoxylase-like metal-dependent hydrolase (beta-lactamase superfamily II)
MVVDRCDLPEGFNVDDYQLFQGTPTRVLKDYDVIDVGGRALQVLHTPGHLPGHMCFFEKERGYLFTGDLAYKGTLYADFPSTDPEAYLASLERVAALPARRVFPAHHGLDIGPEILLRVRDVFRQLKVDGRLHHGGGIFDDADFAVRL